MPLPSAHVRVADDVLVRKIDKKWIKQRLPMVFFVIFELESVAINNYIVFVLSEQMHMTVLG